MHEKECEKLYNCHNTRLRVLHILMWYWIPLAGEHYPFHGLLSPHKSQFTLLDFQSMESLMLGEIGFLARDKLPGRQRALAMAVFKTTAVLPLFQNHSCVNVPHTQWTCHRAKIQPFLLISDQEWANSPAQGGYRKGAKLQKTGRAMTQRLHAEPSVGACSWSLWGRQGNQKYFSNKVHSAFSARGTQHKDFTLLPLF